MTHAHQASNAVKENILHWMKCMCIHPLCLIDLHVGVYT